MRRRVGARPRATDARENSEAWPMRWSQGRYQLRRLPKHDLVGYKGPPIDDNDDCQCLLRRIVAASAMAYASRYTGLIAQPQLNLRVAREGLDCFGRRIGHARITTGQPGSAKSRADAASLFWLRTGWTARHPRRRNDGGRIRLRNWCRFYNFGVDTGRSLDHAPAGVQFVA